MPTKRSARLLHDAKIDLGTKPVWIWGYGKSGKFVCRLAINAAGIAVYSGTKGGKRLVDVNWDKLVEKLAR